jgi:hypothetical protein
MARFVKIGDDIINLDAVVRITTIENQSGVSDRILITVGDTTITVDSGIGGRKRMDAIMEKLRLALKPENWDSPT